MNFGLLQRQQRITVLLEMIFGVEVLALSSITGKAKRAHKNR
jgi:hypothetical protein